MRLGYCGDTSGTCCHLRSTQSALWSLADGSGRCMQSVGHASMHPTSSCCPGQAGAREPRPTVFTARQHPQIEGAHPGLISGEGSELGAGYSGALGGMYCRRKGMVLQSCQPSRSGTVAQTAGCTGGWRGAACGILGLFASAVQWLCSQHVTRCPMHGGDAWLHRAI